MQKKRFELLAPSKTNIHFINAISETDSLNAYNYPHLYYGAGVGAGDFNNDGLIDLYFSGNQVPGRLYINQGDMVFKDITERAGLLKHNSWETGVSIVDVNQDGLQDIYINVSGPPNSNKTNRLYINTGNLKFEESASGDGFKPSGGLYIGDETTVAIENTAADATIRYTLNGSEPTGASPVYKTPLKVRQTTTVKAALFIENKKVSNTNTAFFRLVEDPVDKGITGTFYYGKNLNKLPDFNLLEPVGEKVHGFEFSSEGLDYPKGGDQVAVKFVSYLKVENPGKYTFFTESDDGSKLYINGEAVVDNDGNHGVRPREGTVFLESGKHKVEVTWYNSGGGLWLQTYVEGPGFHRQVLTSDMPNASLSLHTTN